MIAGGSRGSRYSSSLMAARYSASSSTSSSSKSISMCWRLPRAALSWSTRASRLRISSSLASTAEARVIEAKIDVAAGAGATVSVSHCASWSTASTSPEGSSRQCAPCSAAPCTNVRMICQGSWASRWALHRSESGSTPRAANRSTTRSPIAGPPASSPMRTLSARESAYSFSACTGASKRATVATSMPWREAISCAVAPERRSAWISRGASDGRAAATSILGRSRRVAPRSSSVIKTL